MISFYKIKYFYIEYKFEIILITLGIILIGLTIYNKATKKKGSWSKKYYYSPRFNNNIQNKINSQNYDNNNNNNFSSNRGRGGDSKGEIRCREVLEKIFSRRFDKSRPNFLNNPVTGGNFNLELDCFNKELGLAVEYNGQQHYKYVPYFHKNKEAFYNQKYRDELKRRMCKDNNIVLIEVPYNIKLDNIEDFLIKELINNGYLR